MNDSALTAQPISPFIDAHAHVFSRALPLADGRRYAPSYDATLDTYLTLLDEKNFGHAVLVQPSFLGTDNSYLLEALTEEPSRLRGVAVVSSDVSDDELAHLKERGVTGIRLNLVGQPLPEVGAAPWTTLWRRLSGLGWHVELHRNASDLTPLIDSLLEAGLPVVVDHFGRPDPDKGTRDPGFEDLLGFGASGRVWVKISGAYRCSEPGSGFVRDATERLLDQFGAERLMWGSDWPHTQFEHATDFGRTLSTLRELGLDPAVANAILRSTPRAFYGFDKKSARISAPATQFLQRTS
ncbi:hydrolase [Caballeronia arationis]|uniref:amidohydrolase family protein n=1 Tax=Caballeronia arationis TaxID=1777142 RepID=UPI00074BE3DE|nr:amidohydrolase family protein [Caballeronia arationis]SAL05577.1 hydrolase [Caballeronia arationis]